MINNELIYKYYNINKFIFNVTNNLLLCIINISDSYSLLFFEDEMNNKNPIPEEINVYEYDTKNNIYKILFDKMNNSQIILFYGNNYKIEYNGKVLFTYKPTSL